MELDRTYLLKDHAHLKTKSDNDIGISSGVTRERWSAPSITCKGRGKPKGNIFPKKRNVFVCFLYFFFRATFQFRVQNF